MVRALALALALAALPASAQWEQSYTDGWGRISVLGGYRWVPNWYFLGRAEALGFPLQRASVGGPELLVSFGYGATEWLELAVDLFGSYDSFELKTYQPFTSYTYGAVLGPRLTRANVLFKGFTPYAGVEAGATFALATSVGQTIPEQLGAGFTAVVGFHWRLGDRLAIAFDARWLYSRLFVPGLAGLNVGGVTFSLGVSWLFPPRAKHDLEVPGFDRPSHLE